MNFILVRADEFQQKFPFTVELGAHILFMLALLRRSSSNAVMRMLWQQVFTGNTRIAANKRVFSSCTTLFYIKDPHTHTHTFTYTITYKYNICCTFEISTTSTSTSRYHWKDMAESKNENKRN